MHDRSGALLLCVCVGGGMTGNVVGSQVLGCMQVGLECTGAEEGNHAFAVAGKFGTCVFVCALNYCCCHTHPPPPRHTHHTPRRRALLPRRLTPLGRLMTKVGPGSNSNLTTSTCRMCVLCFFLGGRGGVGQRRCGWGGGGVKGELVGCVRRGRRVCFALKRTKTEGGCGRGGHVYTRTTYNR